MLPDGAQEIVYYRLACQTNGSVLVDNGAIPQDYAGEYSTGQPGWSGVVVHFAENCNELNGDVWCIYYEFAATSMTTLNGQTIIVAPDDSEYRFPATGQFLYL